MAGSIGREGKKKEQEGQEEGISADGRDGDRETTLEAGGERHYYEEEMN